MGVYFGTTEITGLYFGDTEITGLYFGDTEIWAAWAEYDGTLPAQYTANGSMLADYRIYGAAGGVGDRTENLFDKDARDTANGYVPGKILQSDGSETINAGYYISEYIDISNLTSDKVTTFIGTSLNLPSLCFYDANKDYISGYKYGGQTIKVYIIPLNAKYCRFTVIKQDAYSSITMLTEGSAAPEEYVPYGYEVDMSISDGTTSTTTPIYIGSSPLEEDEYVDYGEGKAYRRTENLCDGIFINGSLTANGYIPANNRIVSENYLKIDELTITLSAQTANRETILFYYDASKEYVGQSTIIGIGWRALPATATATNDTKYVRIVLRKSDNTTINPSEIQNVMLNSGSTAKSYQPYLQPTDPPVPLPAVPTVDGVTITDYAGQSAAPTEFYAKYRKG